MKKLDCLKLNQNTIKWLETYVEKHNPQSQSFQNRLETFAAASVVDLEHPDAYLLIAHTINQVYKRFGYRYIGRVELMKAYALQAVTQAVIALPATDDFSVRYSIPQKINTLTNDIVKKLERNFRDLSFAEDDYSRELHGELKTLCSVLKNTTDCYRQQVFGLRKKLSETGAKCPFSLSLASDIEVQIKDNHCTLSLCARLLALPFERLKALGEIIKLYMLAEDSKATRSLIEIADDYIQSPTQVNSLEEKIIIAGMQARDRDFLLKLKQGIERRAEERAWGVGMQWLHGRKEVEVAGNNYRVPRRVMAQYKLIQGFLAKECQERVNWSAVKAQVLDIGVKYQASFWSSSKSQAYFILFKPPRCEVDEELESRVLSSFAPLT